MCYLMCLYQYLLIWSTKRTSTLRWCYLFMPLKRHIYYTRIHLFRYQWMWFIIPHILITINILIWLDYVQKSEHVITQDKNNIPWNKNHIPSPLKPRGFSRQSYRSLTEKRQRHSERMTCRRPLQWPLPKW